MEPRRPTVADAPTPEPSPADMVAIPDDQPDRCPSDTDEHPECSWCGGDGWGECDDPIQCLDPRCNGELCPCSACYGRGYDQEVW